MKFLDYDGLLYFWQQIKGKLATKVDLEEGKQLSTNDYTTEEKKKLAGISSGAQANVIETVQLNGSSITPSDKTVNVQVSKSTVGLGNVTNDAQVKRSEMGQAGGVATLDGAGKVPTSQLPSYVDDVIEGYYNGGKFYTTKETNGSYSGEITGESGKIYVNLNDSKTYRWSGTAYVVISETLALGETSSTAYAGNKGAANASEIEKLKEDIGNKATAIIKKESGKTIVINDSSNLPIKTLSGTGKITITGKNILNIKEYNKFVPFEAKAGTLFTLITNGELSEGGNILFKGENDEDVWYAIDAGKTKVSQKIQANVKGYTNLLMKKDGLKYCFSVGENDEFEEYVEQVITAPVDSEQLKAIHTNYPTTVLTSENEISVEYVADTEAYIEKKIQETLISQKILGV